VCLRTLELLCDMEAEEARKSGIAWAQRDARRKRQQAEVDRRER
jgi:hypothetical protein